MANSNCISEYKNKILNELQDDSDFLYVLNVTEEEIEKGLVYTRLFPYFYITDTQTVVKTYICIEVNINSISRNDVYSYPQIIVTIISHQDDMKIDIPSVSATKIDYLSHLIDAKFNGADGFGIGKLVLKTNIEGNLNDVYRYRRLIFKSTDINNGEC